MIWHYYSPMGRPCYLRALAEELEVLIVPEGLPRLSAVCPAPMLSDSKREERFEAAKRGITLDGYHLVSERRVRNKTFDRKGEKTTLKLVYRPCKNEAEAQRVLEKAAIYLKQLAREQGQQVSAEPLGPRRRSPLAEED
jgi:hypothetical protein